MNRWGKYSRQSNEKVDKQNKKKHKLGNTLAERQTDKERGGYECSEDRQENKTETANARPLVSFHCYCRSGILCTGSGRHLFFCC